MSAAPRRRRGPLWISYVPGDELTGPPRVAYAIGKRSGGAVVRNRLRRRLRAAVRSSAQLQPGGAYLIGAGPAATSASYAELEAGVSELLCRLGRP